ncbi:hypothetical protein BN890_11950 [Bacteroides xylanisolvens SD CC 1b]|uniref:Uncharacterized protein n=1 Tax=Bacteroides xylanisolvens SD CC 1b TaxID=702447 RepID=W6P1L5_9BACE|nr:hypothetical protein BN891_8570 [Bacteroides xylanisolvens SD CC 2a]CDM03628.1 hypothetical protein BN890_11950 [Bacteroides xylanisolvens SD CC 1b]
MGFFFKFVIKKYVYTALWTVNSVWFIENIPMVIGTEFFFL